MNVMATSATAAVLSLIAATLIWGTYLWSRYWFGAPRAAAVLVARATRTTGELRKARLINEEKTVKRLQKRLARLELRRSRFEVNLKARITKAARVQADPEAKRSAKRKAARGTRRWESALKNLEQFPDTTLSPRDGAA